MKQLTAAIVEAGSNVWEKPLGDIRHAGVDVHIHHL